MKEPYSISNETNLKILTSWYTAIHRPDVSSEWLKHMPQPSSDSPGRPHQPRRRTSSFSIVDEVWSLTSQRSGALVCSARDGWDTSKMFLPGYCQFNVKPYLYEFLYDCLRILCDHQVDSCSQYVCRYCLHQHVITSSHFQKVTMH